MRFSIHPAAWAILFCGCTLVVHGEEISYAAITAISEHRAVDGTRRGVEDVLRENGYLTGKALKLRYQCAQGSPATAAQIAKMLAEERPTVVVAISTPSAQTMAAAIRTVPIVFASVTDPVAARLITNWSASGTNVTGVSDAVALEEQICFLEKLCPGLRAIGLLYNPSEVNSTLVLKEMGRLLGARQIRLVPAPVQRPADIPLAVRSLKGKVDLIYTPTDNTIGSAYESLAKAADECRIPAITADPELVPRGAAAALGTS
ncbi:MAG: ABC transporter substrate-binding protein, partial [Puniceicoccales bacterium]|nr:ABC transporter substrate-binding protein [Puniceicoccales bacterium]